VLIWSDVVDSALPRQIEDAADVLAGDVCRLKPEFSRLAVRHEHTLELGRLHRIQAEPITFGQRMGLFVAHVCRGIRSRRYVERHVERNGRNPGPGRAGDSRRTGADRSRRRTLRVTRYELIAYARSVAGSPAPPARWSHFALASPDRVDTALSPQIEDAADVLADDLRGLDRLSSDSPFATSTGWIPVALTASTLSHPCLAT
jgi:adenylosuccinate lyase